MTNFKIANIRYTWKNTWVPNVPYTKDDIVFYSGQSYVCLVTHTANAEFSPELVLKTWVVMFDGSSWKNNWTVNTLFNLGDLVAYGSILYQCIQSHSSSQLLLSGSSPEITSGLEADQSKWKPVAQVDGWKNAWAPQTRYIKNDLVKYGSTLYRCIVGHTSDILLELTQSNWEIVSQHYEFTGIWSTSTHYKVNDIIKFSGTLWSCINSHTSVEFLSDAANWSVYIDGLKYRNADWNILASYVQGDVVTYGGYSYRAKVNNQTQVPSTATTFWEIVTEGYRFKNDWNPVTAYYVGDTIRLGGYLYTAIADGTNREPPNGAYWQLVTTGSRWTGLWNTSAAYKLEDLAVFGSSTYSCKLAHSSTVGTRPDTNIAGAADLWKIYLGGVTGNVLSTAGDILLYNAGAKTRLPIGITNQVLTVSGTSVAWKTFGAINNVYYVSPTGVDSLDAGTTIETPWASIAYACQHVVSNSTIFVKTGTYSEILPISIPANVAVVGDELRGTIVQPIAGSTISDMFYMRNGSGLRNMTLQGLSGVLGLTNQYFTQRPSAGAYVGLDAGTGPNDTSVQITNKSPYVQNVTTIGTGCVGLRVNGNLHNAGNRSIVANDFTQVLSDGIGIWVSGLAVVELVSVFTYYCHIGYLAENGGKIRSTNGNNSYGKFGAVSEGVNASETPITANIDNRSTQADVGFVFTDGFRVLGFEYNNAGQSYTSASFNIAGTGSGATASSPVIRNTSIYEIRVVDPSATRTPGGSGYITVVNNAQIGDAALGTIMLAQSDNNLPSNYIGMRIVIISGKGIGQYGYIYDYNSSTKIATIYKESSSTPGWDYMFLNINAVNLDNTSTYSIEPRIIISPPVSGIQAIARVVVTSNKVGRIRMIEPGSGYSTASLPTVTIVDPNKGTEVIVNVRIGNGVLSTPVFSNRGSNFLTATATVTGDGFSDAFQIGSYFYIKNLSYLPAVGANINLESNNTTYKLVTIDQVTGTLGNQKARIQINPGIAIFESPIDNNILSIRSLYSQCRLTGHDFLSIGFGNITETNYPKNTVNLVTPTTQCVSSGGGRVFFTSTDQDGNFSVGGLFAVQQSTGIATLNASAFNLNGLESLSLGAIVLGGTSAIINQFSTDSTFAANSDNILVTQRAIKTYVASRIGQGGNNLQVSSLTAGEVNAAGVTLTTLSNNAINMVNKVNFTGGVDGSMLALTFMMLAK